MSLESEMRRVADDQALVVQAVNILSDAIELNSEMLGKIHDWMQKPVGNALPDALANLATIVDRNTRAVEAMQREVANAR